MTGFVSFAFLVSNRYSTVDWHTMSTQLTLTIYERHFAEHKKPAFLTISALFPLRQKIHVQRRRKSGGDQFSILRRGGGFRVSVVQRCVCVLKEERRKKKSFSTHIPISLNEFCANAANFSFESKFPIDSNQNFYLLLFQQKSFSFLRPFFFPRWLSFCCGNTRRLRRKVTQMSS